jgi:hypothetical protein
VIIIERPGIGAAPGLFFSFAGDELGEGPDPLPIFSNHAMLARALHRCVGAYRGNAVDLNWFYA